MSEQQVFSKCAWRLIPLIMVLYLVNGLDRVNVGFAALTMNRDLGFTPTIYGFGAGVFFLGYALFQIPGNAMLWRIGARRWVFIITAFWGAFSAANALIQSPASFYALRFLLGVAEAGFFPGMVLYLTYWFPQTYRARHTANFMIAVPIANMIGGPLSSLILGLDGLAGLHGWQYLFLVEGVPACILAFVVLRLLPNDPGSASWLTSDEKQYIRARLAADDQVEQRDFWKALRDARVLTLGVIMLGFQLGNYASSLWLPQIVQAMGFSARATGFVLVLPYLAGVAALVFWARSSDLRRERVWHIALSMLLAAVGFTIASVAPTSLLVFFALIFVIIGINATFAPIFSLPSAFLSGPAAASGIALANAIGNLGGFIGPYVVGVLKDRTNGFEAGMQVLAVGLLLAALMVVALGRAIAPRQVVINQTI